MITNKNQQADQIKKKEEEQKKLEEQALMINKPIDPDKPQFY